MKINSIFALVVLSVAMWACDYRPSSSDIQRDRQEKQVQEGVAQVGIPSIKNFRELKLAKDIYELRDQTGLVTYSYLENMNPVVVRGHTALGGKLTFLCDSIGYPLPYAVQFTAPETIQRYLLPSREGSDGARVSGSTRLPQAEPNGLFSPAGAEATWVMCKDSNGKDARPGYVESRVTALQFKLPMD